MDNILDLIIFLVIVYGFLSPFFKKKKEEQSQQDETWTAPQSELPRTQRREYTKYQGNDVLAEIEDFFRKSEFPGIPDSEHNRKPSEAQSYKPERMAEEAYSGTEKTQKKPAVIPPPVLAAAQIPKGTIPISPGIKESVVNEAALRVRNLLKNPETVKDALILSEILQRPKFRYR